MGKSIIQQARGRGSLTYRVRKRAFNKKVSFPQETGKTEILEILHSAAHSAPLMRIRMKDKIFYLPAFNNAFVGQEITIGGSPEVGNVTELRSIPVGTRIYNIERNPRDGGKMIRSAGSSAILTKHLEYGKVLVTMPNKKQVTLSGECRALIGVIAGDGRLNKPFVTAGRKHYKMKARNKLWPRTSPIKVNAVDHPFGSGRGKRPKPKIAQRNASPGQKAGHVRPRRTGYRK